jgi:hypothetical protein
MRSYLVVGNQTLAGPELAAVIAERIASGDPRPATRSRPRVCDPPDHLSNRTVARIVSAALVSGSRVVPSSESTKIATTPSLAVRR